MAGATDAGTGRGGYGRATSSKMRTEKLTLIIGKAESREESIPLSCSFDNSWP